VEPAPITVFFPILTGATKELFDPIKALSRILVLYLFLPS